MSRTIGYLEDLIGFPTVSRDSNLDLIAYVQDVLTAFGIACELVPSEDGRKANLWATIGPPDVSGIVLSGHTDVVPVEDQAWSSDPFTLTRREGNLYGRGSADMKGFIAACLTMAEKATTMPLKTPVHLAFSYDEEVGCVGVRRLLDVLAAAPLRPRLCIVGEPTMMQAVTAHKGKLAVRATAHGLEAHSSRAPFGLNAIYMAGELISEIRHIQRRIASLSLPDDHYDVGYTTVHVGRIAGGEAVNIVPSRCSFDFEIRHMPGEDPGIIVERVMTAADTIAQSYHTAFPEAGFEFEEMSSYPALETPVNGPAVRFLHSLTGGNSTGKISFGTEGGLYHSVLGIPAIVCGPGDIGVAHKADEHISEAQLTACDRMLEKLLVRLAH